MPTRPALLEVQGLKTYFPLEEGLVHAVDGVSFVLHQGETLGVVGESGCGKSVMARSIMRIVPAPGQIVEGRITYFRPAGGAVEAVDLTALDPRGHEIRNIRGMEISMIFQEPMTSLSPVHTIGEQIIEAVRLHQRFSEAVSRQTAIEMLAAVAMPEPERILGRYSYELSGGMCQKAMIAMALVCHPSLLIADEPTTALDVTTEAQILRLMRSLQERLDMAILFITHNLGVIAQLTQRVIVMYLGRVVEEAGVDALFYNPLHPYTRVLLRSIPRPGRHIRGRLYAIQGTVPPPFARLTGCPFHPRCPEVRLGVCDVREPPWVHADVDHWVRCILYESG